MANKVEIKIKLPVSTKKKAKGFISYCSVLDVYSQGSTEKEAKKNIMEALKLFLISCFERGTLDAVLKECGFKAVRKTMKLPDDQRFATVPDLTQPMTGLLSLTVQQ